MSTLLLALDFGGTKLAAAAAQPGRQTWLAYRRVLSPAAADGPEQYATMLALARDLLQETGLAPAAVGVSFGGPVDAPAGVARMSPHVPGWENVPLAARLVAEFGVPAAIQNDANAAALGEFWFGAGQGCKNLLYVTVSTGIGGGWILNGRLYTGADGLAGEIGHTLVQPGGLPCACGRRGCLEAEAAGPAIARQARLSLSGAGADAAALLNLAGGNPEAITAQMVGRAAAAGNQFSKQILSRAGARLGTGLANAINLLNPERVILGGGVTAAGPVWWQAVRRAAQAAAMPGMRVNIIPAALGHDAPLWGAVALAGMAITPDGRYFSHEQQKSPGISA